MKTISIFSNIRQAGAVQAWLALNEIDSFIPEEDTIGMLPYLAVSSGIHLQVADEDFERAEELVKDFFEEEASRQEASQAQGPDHCGAFDGASNEKGSQASASPMQMSKNFARNVFFTALIVNILTYPLSLTLHADTPSEVDYFLSGLYASYDAAMLRVYFYYLSLILFPIAFIGLFYFKNWARQLFTGLWAIILLFSPFSVVSYSAGLTLLFETIGGLMAGFIFCLIYFTPVSGYFKENRVSRCS